MKKLIAALFIAATPVAHAQAEFETVQSLYGMMNGNQNERLVAMGYIVGIHDALSGLTVCSPDSITKGQVRDLIKIYIDNNPKLRSNSTELASKTVAQALAQVWPCRK